MKSGRIAMLVQGGDSTSIVYHALALEFDVVGVVVEDDVPRNELVRRRLRKLGVATVVGQLAFRAFVVPPLARRARGRIDAICRENDLDRSPIPRALVRDVPSVNSDAARDALRALCPDLVVVNGTRIIGKETLDAVRAPFVNTHTGITPMYRGVHGGYWALAQGDPARCGVTVHRVDTGIDTGAILGQATIAPSAEDSFVTYPYLQYAAAVPVLKRAVRDVLAGVRAESVGAGGESRLWSHPTLGEYVRNRVLRGVR